VQALQLTRAGRDQRLQTPSLLAALTCLGESQLLPPEAVSELRAAYVYLRRLENRLQMLADAQVHSLRGVSGARAPGARHGCARLAALMQELDAHRARVSRHFRLLVQGGAEPDRGAVRIDLEDSGTVRRKPRRSRRLWRAPVSATARKSRDAAGAARLGPGAQAR